MRLSIEVPTTNAGVFSKAPGPRIRSADEAQVIAVIEGLNLEWRAPEQQSKARPARRCPPPAAKRPPRREAPRLTIEEVLAVIPAPILAELMGVEHARFRYWNTVPRTYHDWARDLLRQWPVVREAYDGIKSGMRPYVLAKHMGMRITDLANLCAEFGVPWPLED